MAPPKKTDAAPKAKSSHASYQDMITDAIIALKDRTGSSRQSLKKYVRANNTITATDKMFDALFNKALKSGVDKGIFEQPKGPSGTTKLSKKNKPAAKPAAKKEQEAKETGEKEVKKAAPKKEGAKKATTTKKAAAPKKEKEATEKKPAAKKEKAVAPKKAAPKKAAVAKKDKEASSSEWRVGASATEKPAAISKTKTGRVEKKTAAKPAAKKAAAPKKAAPKKEKTPKKEAKAEAAT
ncbi:hypothetical protein F5Y17DRAFT_444397 [Xylariaceae sp. FL0594]|nr:hypothetical protein F5Y17DRAFT_444397 [Xylariaceae sp. FL0594]